MFILPSKEHIDTAKNRTKSRVLPEGTMAKHVEERQFIHKRRNDQLEQVKAAFAAYKKEIGQNGSKFEPTVAEKQRIRQYFTSTV